ncbi:MAG: sodium:glutamate symporter [Bacillota bacterium]|nr:sodium:glutamate symporter [Bacillota bacterium]
MDFSSSNIILWSAVLQFGILAVMILIANVLRIKVPFVRKSLMPTSVLAGFILLLLRVMGLVQVDTDLMEMLLYHAIAIGFIALSLQIPRDSDKPAKGDFIAAKSGALIISTYLVQGLIGLVISAGLAYTVMPDFFKAAGILLPMGYGQGSGQANNVGSTYQALGFKGGQSFGLSIAAMGYLVACVVGIAYLNIMKKRGVIHGGSTGTNHDTVIVEEFESKDEPPVSESVDRLSIQFALIFVIYLFTYLVTLGIVDLLKSGAPGLAKTLSPLLWGFNFIIGSLLAQVCHKIFKCLTKAGLMTHQHVNNYLLGRIAGFAFDIMVIAGIATINIEDLSGLWLPFWLMAIAGAVITLWYLQWLCRKIYPDYYYEGMLSMYGMLTGNISSGMMLLREIDPSFKTPAATNLLTGSSVAIALGAPMLIFIGLAPQSDSMLLLTIVFLAIYLVPLVLFILKAQHKRKADDNDSTGR